MTGNWAMYSTNTYNGMVTTSHQRWISVRPQANEDASKCDLNVFAHRKFRTQSSGAVRGRSAMCPAWQGATNSTLSNIIRPITKEIHMRMGSQNACYSQFITSNHHYHTHSTTHPLRPFSRDLKLERPIMPPNPGKSRLLHIPSFAAIGLSGGYEVYPPIGWHQAFVIDGSKYSLGLPRAPLHHGLTWPVGIPIVFQMPLTIPLHNPNGRQCLPVVRAVEWDCENHWCNKWDNIPKWKM